MRRERERGRGKMIGKGIKDKWSIERVGLIL
jgi:hypothetical protein